MSMTVHICRLMIVIIDLNAELVNCSFCNTNTSANIIIESSAKTFNIDKRSLVLNTQTLHYCFFPLLLAASYIYYNEATNYSHVQFF